MGPTAPIVVDASALLDLLTGQDSSSVIEAALTGAGKTLHAPMVLDEEVLSVVRRLERSGMLDKRRAEELLADATALDIKLHELRPHFDRVWSLRQTIHVADAYYVSLAETLNAPMLTTDQRLVRGVAASSDIEILPL